MAPFRQRPHSRPASLYIVIAMVSLAALMSHTSAAQIPQQVAEADVQSPGWWTLLPPVVAIAIALIFRSVIPALFLGIWCGAMILNGWGLTSIWTAFLDSFDTHLVNAIADADRVRVLLFTMMLGGMIGILGRNGGMRGIVARTTRFASNAVRGQLVTASLGLVIFFDDIANTLLIGKTMRPVTDRLRISREKLAYLVDSTAAPIAGIAVASTWVGYEVSVIGATAEGIAGLDTAPYLIFLASIPYSFYSIIALFMVFAVAWSARDFGPMHQAEIAARRKPMAVPSADAEPDSHKPAMVARHPAVTEGTADQRIGNVPYKIEDSASALNAVVPILAVVTTLFAGLLITGSGDSIQEILGSADSFLALMWASLLGVVCAAAITTARRILTLNQTVDAWFEGVRTTLIAVVVLTLSWTLADIVQSLNTAEYIIGISSDRLPLFLLPSVSFVLGGIVAFTTGTSWGTMGILMPLMLPLSWSLLTGSADGGMAEQMYIFHGSVAGVLAGAIWGDHCSPISDTTVLSSLASDCDHIEHVRTQLPYAMTAGTCALFLCALPVGLGVPWWLCLIVSFGVVAGVLKVLGKSTEVEPSRLTSAIDDVG